MIFNFFAQIFGKSTYKSSEIITTTIVENDPNIDVDADDDDDDASDGEGGSGASSGGSVDDITINTNNCYLMAADAATASAAAGDAAASPMPCQRAFDAGSSTSTDDAKLTTSTDCNYRRLLSSLPFSGGKRRGHNLTVQFQQQTTNHNKTNQINDMNKSRKMAASRRSSKSMNGISVYTVYTLFVAFFICICTIAILLMAYVNRVNDIALLRADLNGKFVGRSDIDVIVRNILHELQADDDGMSTFKRR